MKSVSPSLASHGAAPHEHSPFNLLPHGQASEEAGLTFSVLALEQLHSKAGLAPQEQVDF